MARTPQTVERSRCTDLDGGRRLEWLVTNGCGGFAMCAVNQMLTRRYHGLLVAAVQPPVQRFVLLAKLEATVSIEGLTYDLATNDYSETIHPRGHKRLESFSLRPFPTWHWRAGEALIEQTLCMVRGEDTTFVRYRLLEGEQSVELTVQPLCTSRHFHHLTDYAEMGPPNVESDGEFLRFHWARERPAWQLSHTGEFQSRPDWFYGFMLAAEQERGQKDASQDLFTPGPIRETLRRDDTEGLVIVASTQARPTAGCDAAFAAARLRDEQLDFGLMGDDPLLDPLVRATDAFIVRRDEDLKTVVAGYPWFGDWGRDTFISLSGLCLVPGRFGEARKIIRAFARHVNQGMIPNRFPPFGEAPAYDTVDATLWYIHGIDRYLSYSGDWALITDELFPVVTEILDAHERGTRHGIGIADDGLLTQGEEGYALTWMDAKLPDLVVTPRRGKAVEINALWYNALIIGVAFANRIGDAEAAERWARLAERVRASFNERFWNTATDCLFDVVDVDGEAGRDDASVRPNQLLAISLTHPVLDPARHRAVADVCERELWTPLGLRTLSPNDPNYCGRFEGDMRARDSAYHQGTVWPWLLGPFVTAYVRAQGGHADVRRRGRKFLDGLLPHFSEAGLAGVTEVADGDAPHLPGGCPWQAWSVAEPLRALCEDILQTHPEAGSEEVTSGAVASNAMA
jgi:predicted glycogen debranching enzyme